MNLNDRLLSSTLTRQIVLFKVLRNNSTTKSGSSSIWIVSGAWACGILQIHVMSGRKEPRYWNSQVFQMENFEAQARLIGWFTTSNFDDLWESPGFWSTVRNPLWVDLCVDHFPFTQGTLANLQVEFTNPISGLWHHTSRTGVWFIILYQRRK